MYTKNEVNTWLGWTLYFIATVSENTQLISFKKHLTLNIIQNFQQLVFPNTVF